MKMKKGINGVQLLRASWEEAGNVAVGLAARSAGHECA